MCSIENEVIVSMFIEIVNYFEDSSIHQYIYCLPSLEMKWIFFDMCLIFINEWWRYKWFTMHSWKSHQKLIQQYCWNYYLEQYVTDSTVQECMSLGYCQRNTNVTSKISFRRWGMSLEEKWWLFLKSSISPSG